uniref:Uncharacterized protein n=1 Tax=Arundo donax TaxID=35708 RepID=A0A0A9APN5_ARUDO
MDRLDGPDRRESQNDAGNHSRHGRLKRSLGQPELWTHRSHVTSSKNLITT